MHFEPQTFQFADLGVIGVLILLEALLSADNALILAIIVRHLPKDQQRKALFYGLAGAFVFRLAAILMAKWVMQLWWLQAIGAAYLIYLPLKHFLGKEKEKTVKAAAGAGFWATVLQAELTDIAFAVDSVLVAVAMVPSPNKIWVVYAGAILGVILLRWAAGLFLRLLERFPALDAVAYVLVGWAGVKLVLFSGHSFEKVYPGALPFHVPEMSPVVFWTVLALIVAVGAAYAFKNPHTPTLDEDEATEMAIELAEEGPSEAVELSLEPEASNDSQEKGR